MPDASQFGKYRLIKPLAQGGMAEIFLAKQQGPAGFEKTVVLKRVLPHLSQNAEFVQMFLDEARLAARLSHPNIVQIFDFGEAEGAYYLCMEHLSGEDLGWVVRKAREKGQPIPAQIAAIVVAAAADALHYAHTLADDEGRPLHIVHRDISPSNLFLTYQGQVKVLDFGIAKAEGKLVRTHAGVIKGKVSYMSPEQGKGQRLDARSDVFALGAVLHELLTGKRLFSRGSELETLRAATTEPIPTVRSIRAEVPEELEAATMKALERDLARRFQSAAELAAALDEFLAARTYVPVPAQLQDFLKNLVGEEEIKRRTKVPTESRAVHATAATIQEGKRPEPQPQATRSLRASGKLEPGKRKRVIAIVLAVGLAAGVGGAALVAREGRPVPDFGGAGSDRPGGGGPETTGAGAGGSAAATGLTAPSDTGTGAAGTGASGTMAATGAPSPASTGDSTAGSGPSAAIGAGAGGSMATTGASTPTGAAGAAGASPAQPGTSGKRAGGVPAQVAQAGARQPSVARGTLDVNCVPWCQIYLDEKDTGRTSPAIGISLTAGRHRLRVVNPPTGVEREKIVVIKAGATTRELINF